jgi:hypothetical protein
MTAHKNTVISDYGVHSLKDCCNIIKPNILERVTQNLSLTGLNVILFPERILLLIMGTGNKKDEADLVLNNLSTLPQRYIG